MPWSRRHSPGLVLPGRVTARGAGSRATGTGTPGDAVCRSAPLQAGRLIKSRVYIKHAGSPPAVHALAVPQSLPRVSIFIIFAAPNGGLNPKLAVPRAGQRCISSLNLQPVPVFLVVPSPVSSSLDPRIPGARSRGAGSRMWPQCLACDGERRVPKVSWLEQRSCASLRIPSSSNCQSTEKRKKINKKQ